MTYSELLDWLFVRFPSFQVAGDRACKLGLERISLFVKQLGSPDKAYPTIHVAGTNGKGSTSSMTAAALASCGYRVGLYTSPHLTDFRERMKLISADGWSMISEAEVEAFLKKWMDVFEQDDLSFFEITTGMALEWFAQQKVDAAVIEVGLGGRLDATNIITPRLSVITNIALEHCQYLGNTLQEIAFEKGGIIKPGVPAVIGETLPETKPVFEKLAAERGSRIVFAEDFTDSYIPVELSEMDLQGDYQKRNLRTLNAVLRELPAAGFDIDLERAAEGVRHAAAITGLRGRWETLRPASGDRRDPAKGRAQVICDTGHNAHAFRWLREQIDSISCNYDTIFFVFGVVADKDVHAVADFLPHDVQYIFTTPDTGRAIKAADLANILSDYGINGKVVASPIEAFSYAEQRSTAADLIFIAGSNYLVSDILTLAL